MLHVCNTQFIHACNIYRYIYDTYMLHVCPIYETCMRFFHAQFYKCSKIFKSILNAMTEKQSKLTNNSL